MVLFVQLQVCMELGRDRGFILKDSLESWLFRVFIIRLFLLSRIPIAIKVTKAKQKKIMKETIPQSENSESIVFVGTLVGFVELNDRPVTIKMELAS